MPPWIWPVSSPSLPFPCAPALHMGAFPLPECILPSRNRTTRPSPRLPPPPSPPPSPPPPPPFPPPPPPSPGPQARSTYPIAPNRATNLPTRAPTCAAQQAVATEAGDVRISAQHSDVIHDVAFDLYGRRMATCASDHTVKVWDLDDQGAWKTSASFKVRPLQAWEVVGTLAPGGHTWRMCGHMQQQAARGSASRWHLNGGAWKRGELCCKRRSE